MSCPICGKPVAPPMRPFCSKRCADVDLAKWLNGSYAVASNDPDDLDALEEALQEAAQDDGPQRPH